MNDFVQSHSYTSVIFASLPVMVGLVGFSIAIFCNCTFVYDSQHTN